MNWITFFKSKLFFISLALALIITSLLVWFTLHQLDSYTHHGEKITIPNLYGKSTKAAIQELKNKELRYSIYDSVYNKDLKPGVILKQQPPAGGIVKRNRNIFLTINSHQPEQIVFPNIKDNSLRQACEVLKINGFKVGRLIYAPNQFYNLVLFTTINNDTIFNNDKVSKGSTVNLILGDGRGRKIFAPNLMGKNLNNSSSTLQYAGLNCGNIIFDASIKTQEDSLRAQVFKQIPNYSTVNQIKPGSNINLYLTVDEMKVKLFDSLQQRIINHLPIDSSLLKSNPVFLKIHENDKQ